jgi:hypothetical protein
MDPVRQPDNCFSVQYAIRSSLHRKFSAKGKNCISEKFVTRNQEQELPILSFLIRLDIDRLHPPSQEQLTMGKCETPKSVK